MFAASAASAFSSTGTTLNTGVPSPSGSGKITVQTSAGLATSTADFYAVPPPYTVANVGFTGRVAVGSSSNFSVSPIAPLGLLLFDGTAGQSIQISIDCQVGNG